MGCGPLATVNSAHSSLGRAGSVDAVIFGPIVGGLTGRLMWLGADEQVVGPRKGEVASRDVAGLMLATSRQQIEDFDGNMLMKLRPCEGGTAMLLATRRSSAA
jgi:hypothetical protein